MDEYEYLLEKRKLNIQAKKEYYDYLRVVYKDRKISDESFWLTMGITAVKDIYNNFMFKREEKAIKNKLEKNLE